VVVPAGFSHVRLTVTDIQRSKNFYRWLLGREPGSDFSDQIDEPGVRKDPVRTYGGCSFTFAGQTHRPSAGGSTRRPFRFQVAIRSADLVVVDAESRCPTGWRLPRIRRGAGNVDDHLMSRM
jgi:catechol 2,3-dioxygenase-like lactoylglutathione lyase family enzyme